MAADQARSIAPANQMLAGKMEISWRFRGRRYVGPAVRAPKALNPSRKRTLKGNGTNGNAAVVHPSRPA
jgi:hypothetical protein